jgi:chromosome segregation ATPase
LRSANEKFESLNKRYQSLKEDLEKIGTINKLQSSEIRAKDKVFEEKEELIAKVNMLSHALNIQAESGFDDKQFSKALQVKYEKIRRELDEFKSKELTYKREIEYLTDKLEEFNGPQSNRNISGY